MSAAEQEITPTPSLGMAMVSQGQGYDDEFDGFFRKEYSRVVKVVMYAGATFEEAEDAVSPAMARAYVRWPLLTQPDAWVRIVALRNYLKEVMGDRRRGRLETEAGHRDCLDRLPVKTHEEPDERSWVITVLRRLPPAQLTAMALTFDGYTATEIAQMLDLDASTVRSNLRHARKRLRDEFESPAGGQAVAEKGASD
jgi:RNA polymerase sigma-70 factor (ECF subfamily)